MTDDLTGQAPDAAWTWTQPLAHGQDPDVAAALLWAAGALGVWVRTDDVVGYFADQVDGLAGGTWEAVEEVDWLERWREGIEPVAAGGFVVVPTWLADADDLPSGQPILLDPGRAFGSGHHDTTAGCLEEVGNHVRTGMQVFDVGTGTGVLAIAAAMRGATVTAVDIDPDAVVVAGENASANGVQITTAVGSADAVAPGSMDVVLANLLTHTIVALADELVEALVDDGLLVASGIGEARAPEAVAALEAAGLRDVTVRIRGEWAIVLGRRHP